MPSDGFRSDLLFGELSNLNLRKLLLRKQVMKQRRLFKHSEVQDEQRGGSERLTKRRPKQDYSQSDDDDSQYSSQSEEEMEVQKLAA